jgi:hypothetical protein
MSYICTAPLCRTSRLHERLYCRHLNNVATAGLDPTWEQTFEFDVADEATTKCFVKFMMGAEGEEKQIGDECEWGEHGIQSGAWRGGAGLGGEGAGHLFVRNLFFGDEMQ